MGVRSSTGTQEHGNALNGQSNLTMKRLQVGGIEEGDPLLVTTSNLAMLGKVRNKACHAAKGNAAKPVVI